MAEGACAKNAVQALARVELFGAAHGARQLGPARDALLHTHVASAPLVAALARQLRRQHYRRACATLEQLVSLLCVDDPAAVDAFVRAGGVPEVWRVLALDDAEVAARYRSEAPAGADGSTASTLFEIVMRILGRNEPVNPPPPADDDDDGSGGDRYSEALDMSTQEGQGEEEQDGVVGDPALERFGAEDSSEAEEGAEGGEEQEEEEEDVYVPANGEGDGLSSMAQIAATMINQPRHSEWLLTALRKQAVLLLREAAFVVRAVSKETVCSPTHMSSILRFLGEKSTFFTTIPLLEELSAQNIAGCDLASQGLSSPFHLTSCFDLLHGRSSICAGVFFTQAKEFRPFQVVFSSRFIANMCFDPMQNKSGLFQCSSLFFPSNLSRSHVAFPFFFSLSSISRRGVFETTHTA